MEIQASVKEEVQEMSTIAVAEVEEVVELSLPQGAGTCGSYNL